MPFRLSLASLPRILSRLRLLALVLAAGASLAHAADAASQGRRIALVIGNGDYKYPDNLPKLPNPTHDAEDIAAALRGFGFEVIERKNQTLEAMNQTIAEFGSKIGGSEAALFYFAGHGIQVKNQNYLMPVNAKIDSEAAVPYQGVDMNRVLDEMDNGKSGVNIVMLDACRNNPISGKFRSGKSRGLASPGSAPQGTVIVYATDPGNVAADGDGRNGLFSAGLLAAFKGGDLSLDGVLTAASEYVEQKSVESDPARKQTPYVNGPKTVQKNFHFRVTVDPGRGEIERTFWTSIERSTDPADFEAYLHKYPKGSYRALAENQIKRLKAGKPAAPVAMAAPRPPAVPPVSQKDYQTVPPRPQLPAPTLALASPAYTPARPTEIPATSAGAYPNKPLRLIVPFAAGGSTDIVARLLAQTLTQRLGQPVIVENRPGAGGMIGLDVVAKSAPDGYTLLLGSSATMSIGSQLYRSVPANIATDMQPVAILTRAPMALLVNSGSPYARLRQLVDDARRSPGRLTYATPGAGGASHLAGVAFATEAGIDITHVPYKGAGPATSDLLGGQVNLAFLESASAAPQIKAGKLRALAITGDRRQAEFPDVPTFAELGMAGMDVNPWTGIFAPPATPANIARHLNAELRRALQQQDLIDGLARISTQAAAGGSHEEFAAFVRDDAARMARWIKAGKIQID